ncbi:MAG: TerB family tellurite resistance protein [Myxococcales bacterium]|nr:TerB family tellurite resistance protein [Myxococcales bacterium]
MALSLQTQWTLVASGLVAHADHVLAGEECERLMALVDQEVDGDEYAQWMAAISDPDQLRTMLVGLAVPPPETHREILEEAWLMAVVDGERADEELDALRRVAERLGVESMQLDFWREAWTTAQQRYADDAVAVLGWVLGGGGPVLADDQATVDDFVHALPTTHEHRETLRAAGRVPQDRDGVDRRVHGLGKPQRRDLLRRLVEAIPGAARPDDARDRWQALAEAMGLSSEELERLG